MSFAGANPQCQCQEVWHSEVCTAAPCREAPHAHSRVQFCILGFIKCFTSICRDLTQEGKTNPPKPLSAVRAACARYPGPEATPAAARGAAPLHGAETSRHGLRGRIRGQTTGFPQAKVHFEEEKTTSSLYSRKFTDQEGKYLHNSTAALFLMRKRQPVLVLAGKGLKIAVSSSSKRASFFKTTKSLQDLSDVEAKTNFLTGNRIYGHVLSTLVWGWWGKEIPCAKRRSRSNQRIMLEMHCDWGMNVCNSFVGLPTNRKERETPATLHPSQENVFIPRISGYE